jgi:hypothetical protein
MRELVVSAFGLDLGSYRTISRDQVSEIQIRHRGRLTHFGRVTDRYACHGDGYDCIFLDPRVLLVLPVDLALGAVATPPMLVVEGSRRLWPARILKIMP